MMDKLVFWFSENRKKIGYTLGILNLLLGVNSVITGQTNNGIIMIFVGSVIIFDAWSMP